MLDKIVQFSKKIKLAVIGLRKFSVMLLLIIIPVWMRIADLMTGEDVAKVFTGVGAAFMAGNMVEKVTEVIKAKLDKDK